MCQGTGSIRPGALSKGSAASSVHLEQHVDVALGAITVGSIVNATLDKTGKPLEHSIVADHGCELYCIEMKELVDVCNGSKAMLQGLYTECKLMEDWHSRRKDDAQGAHSKLQEQDELLLHPRPEEEFGGEKPNPTLLHLYRPLPLNPWSKALGSTSFSKSGVRANKLLKTPLPSKHSGGDSPGNRMGEVRAKALGLYNMEHIKTKHAAATCASSSSQAPELAPPVKHLAADAAAGANSAGQEETDADMIPSAEVFRISQSSRRAHNESGGSLLGVDEDDEGDWEEGDYDEESNTLANLKTRTEPRKITHFSGQLIYP